MHRNMHRDIEKVLFGQLVHPPNFIVANQIKSIMFIIASSGFREFLNHGKYCIEMVKMQASGL